MGMNIMVMGSGGREHAISYKLSLSPLVDRVFCLPGNGGTALEPKCTNINNSGKDIVAIAKSHSIDFVVIGPEVPLAQGVADELWAGGIPCVGPIKAAARLEASKDYAKHFMAKYNVASAESQTFTTSQIDSAVQYIKDRGAPIVIKADGLAAGKGVVVASTIDEAIEATRSMLSKNSMGDAGHKVVIEEYLTGDEVSILAAVNVTKGTIERGTSTIMPFISARDHKRLLDGAKGPNTGGMGAIAPVADYSGNIEATFYRDILEPTLQGIIAEGYEYRGFIFFGLMLTAQGPKVLEYNVRLGDPETQAVLPLMKSDFAALCRAILSGELKDFTLQWDKGYIVAPMAVSSGYPHEYKKGYPIYIDSDAIKAIGVKPFVSGAIIKGDTLVTSGGRVISLASKGDTIELARARAYEALNLVNFEGMYYRKDIGLPGAARSI